jgi:hypothetical protein
MIEISGINSETPNTASIVDRSRIKFPLYLLKEEIPLHQQIAAALGQAGLDTYAFMIASVQALGTQIDDQPIAQGSPYARVDYEGPKDRTGFYRVFDRANRIRKDMGFDKKRKSTISKAVRQAIEEGIAKELKAQSGGSVNQT